MRRIILFVGGFNFLFVIISYLLIVNNPSAYQHLYEYQLHKLRSQKEFKTLFIGDSSLGNSIDSEEFTQLSGEESLNCALTGLFGYAGSFNILKTAHKYHPEIKNIIVMQSVDIQTRPVSYAGYVRTVNSFSDFISLDLQEKKYFISSLVEYVRSIDLSLSIRNPITNDYVRQAKKTMLTSKSQKLLNSDAIKSGKNHFLNKIVDYCSENDLNLIYVHGPYLETELDRSQIYIAEINNLIRSTGAKLIDDVVGIKVNHIGDTPNHVHPSFKVTYTAIYYDLLKSYIN